MNGSNFVDKRGALFFFLVFLLLYIKMSEYGDLNYYQRNRDVILIRAKDHYENDKERLKEQARYK